MTEKIVALAKALGAETDQEELLSVLCQAAQQELEGRLRPGVTPEVCFYERRMGRRAETA